MGQTAFEPYLLEIIQNYHHTFAYCILDLINACNVSTSTSFTLLSVLKSEWGALFNVKVV